VLQAWLQNTSETLPIVNEAMLKQAFVQEGPLYWPKFDPPVHVRDFLHCPSKIGQEDEIPLLALQMR